MDGEQMSFSTREIRLIKTVPKICMLKSVTGALWIFFGLVDMSFVFKARINGLYIIALWAIAGALFALSKRSVNEGRKVLTQSNFDYRDESDLRRKFVMVNLIQYGAILAAGFATYLYLSHFLHIISVFALPYRCCPLLSFGKNVRKFTALLDWCSYTCNCCYSMDLFSFRRILLFCARRDWNYCLEQRNLRPKSIICCSKIGRKV